MPQRHHTVAKTTALDIRDCACIRPPFSASDWLQHRGPHFTPPSGEVFGNDWIGICRQAYVVFFSYSSSWQTMTLFRFYRLYRIRLSSMISECWSQHFHICPIIDLLLTVEICCLHATLYSQDVAIHPMMVYMCPRASDWVLGPRTPMPMPCRQPGYWMTSLHARIRLVRKYWRHLRMYRSQLMQSTYGASPNGPTWINTYVGRDTRSSRSEYSVSPL